MKKYLFTTRLLLSSAFAQTNPNLNLQTLFLEPTLGISDMGISAGLQINLGALYEWSFAFDTHHSTNLGLFTETDSKTNISLLGGKIFRQPWLYYSFFSGLALGFYTDEEAISGSSGIGSWGSREYSSQTNFGIQIPLQGTIGFAKYAGLALKMRSYIGAYSGFSIDLCLPLGYLP